LAQVFSTARVIKWIVLTVVLGAVAAAIIYGIFANAVSGWS